MKRIHSLLVVLLLLAYAGTATAVMPAVFAALAELDGSHRVMICRTEQGMQVRLHHREDDYTPEVCDHTGLLAKLVVSFCRPEEEGDHSLSSNQVTGTLTGPDEEAKKFIKDKQCSSLERVDYDTRQASVILEVVCRNTLRDSHHSRAVALREMSTIRLLI
ncbi:MAG: hypothetical protein NTY98_17965 [Verrucomicrobia bacterium]|nr:hypothetical protein [Verrucomicrobiota bacterium]